MVKPVWVRANPPWAPRQTPARQCGKGKSSTCRCIFSSHHSRAILPLIFAAWWRVFIQQDNNADTFWVKSRSSSYQSCEVWKSDSMFPNLTQVFNFQSTQVTTPLCKYSCPKLLLHHQCKWERFTQFTQQTNNARIYALWIYLYEKWQQSFFF